ncbi:hypothetical protein QBC35DRAFT_499364, partial [Podospora australis]
MEPLDARRTTPAACQAIEEAWHRISPQWQDGVMQNAIAIIRYSDHSALLSEIEDALRMGEYPNPSAFIATVAMNHNEIPATFWTAASTHQHGAQLIHDVLEGWSSPRESNFWVQCMKECPTDNPDDELSLVTCTDEESEMAKDDDDPVAPALAKSQQAEQGLVNAVERRYYLDRMIADLVAQRRRAEELVARKAQEEEVARKEVWDALSDFWFKADRKGTVPKPAPTAALLGFYRKMTEVKVGVYQGPP